MNNILLRVLAVVLSGVSPELCWNGRNNRIIRLKLAPGLETPDAGGH